MKREEDAADGREVLAAAEGILRVRRNSRTAAEISPALPKARAGDVVPVESIPPARHCECGAPLWGRNVRCEPCRKARRARTAEERKEATQRANALANKAHEVAERAAGKGRLVKVVSADGRVVGEVPHRRVLAGVARATEIELAVQEGKRPKQIVCPTCGVHVIKVPKSGGRIPSKCDACKAPKMRTCMECGAEFAVSHNKQKSCDTCRLHQYSCGMCGAKILRESVMNRIRRFGNADGMLCRPCSARHCQSIELRRENARKMNAVSEEQKSEWARSARANVKRPSPPPPLSRDDRARFAKLGGEANARRSKAALSRSSQNAWATRRANAEDARHRSEMHATAEALLEGGSDAADVAESLRKAAIAAHDAAAALAAGNGTAERKA